MARKIGRRKGGRKGGRGGFPTGQVAKVRSRKVMSNKKIISANRGK